MAPVEAAGPGLFARDIVAYSDAELDWYLEENARFVDVEDPENLPEDFIQRLRDRTHRTNATTETRPFEPDQLAALLRKHAGRERAPSRETTAPLDESEENKAKEYQEDLQFQTKCYNALVEAGGWPSHPLSRIEDITKSPGVYREILSYWQKQTTVGIERQKKEWRVFSVQLRDWQEFQRLQRYARTQNGYDYWRSEWEDRVNRHHLHYGEYRPIIEGYYVDPEEEWQEEWQRRLKKYSERGVVYVSGYRQWWEFVEREGRPVEGEGFPEYVEALKERLAKHGFTRTFQLDEDLARQDKLTTWIEYLGYECWLHDQHWPPERRQQWVDEAWKELVDSNVLRPGETDEILYDDGATFQRANERERAEKAVRSAESAVSSAKRVISKPQQCRTPLQQLQQRLVTAQSTLEAAKKRHEFIKRRNDCITEYFQQTKNARISKREVEHHSKLLRWVLQQFPLIELEFNAPNVVRGDSEQNDSGRKRKRAEELDEEPHSQEQRHVESDRRSTSDRKTRTGSVSQGGETRELRTKAVIDDEPASKRRKNNGRALRLPDLPIPSRPTSDSSDVTKIRQLDPSESAAKPSKARVKGSKASTDQSSRTSRLLRRSGRIAKRLNSTAITSSASINNVGPRSRRLRP